MIPNFQTQLWQLRVPRYGYLCTVRYLLLKFYFSSNQKGYTKIFKIRKEMWKFDFLSDSTCVRDPELFIPEADPTPKQKIANYRTVSHLWWEHFYRLLPSRCDTEKGEREGKRHWTDNKNNVSSCVAWGYLRSHGLRRQRNAYKAPPSYPPPFRLWTDFGSLAKSREWPPFWRLWVW